MKPIPEAIVEKTWQEVAGFRMVFMRDKSKSLIWEEKLFETLENAMKA
jgi:hypothetical protein